MNLKFVTWNILADLYIKADRYPGVPTRALEPARRRALMLEQIAAMDADVYLLQEVEQGAHDAIAEVLGGAYEGTLALKSGRAEGSAMFTRRERIEAAETRALVYDTQGDGRGTLALMARLVVDGAATLGVASTHLEWSRRDTPRERHAGLAQMMELLEARADLIAEDVPWILGGDMNAISQSHPIEAALASGLRLACREQRPWDTVNINRRRRKLDYLLYTPGRLTPSPGVLPRLSPDEPMPSLERASDHLPVEVAFELT